MRYNKLIKITAVLAAVVVLGFYIRLDYFIIRPSRAVDLRDLITVADADQGDQGSFFLVTVSQQRASLITAAYGILHPHMDINPMERVIPSGMDESEYRQLLTDNMVESQHLAQVVALRRSGYEVDIISDGVEVIRLSDDAPASGYLEVGDKIIYVDDNPVFLATEIPLLVQDRQAGELVEIIIIRGNREIELAIPTGENPDTEGMPYLGIFIKTLPWEPVIPVEIIMKTGRIGGPSAGLMFVLEIMNQLLPEDLTAGKVIAGTGTIDLTESIGRIGGVRQKVIAAENAGADYFFLPAGNYEQAKSIASKVELIPVENLEEVLDFLAAIESD